MELLEVLGILGVYSLSDFLVQYNAKITGKKDNIESQLEQSVIYSGLWYCTGLVYIMFSDIKCAGFKILMFMGITLILHFLINALTRRFKYKPLGVETNQYLHYIQLFVTFYCLFK